MFLKKFFKYFRKRFHNDLLQELNALRRNNQELTVAIRTLVDKFDALENILSCMEIESLGRSAVSPTASKVTEQIKLNNNSYKRIQEPPFGGLPPAMEMAPEFRLTSFQGKDDFAVTRQINISRNFENIGYLSYLMAVNKTSNMARFWGKLPEGTYEWWCKIQHEREVNGDVNIYRIFPKNKVNNAIGTALFIALLKRIPENDSVIDCSPAELCRRIFSSGEYRKKSGANIKDWLKS